MKLFVHFIATLLTLLLVLDANASDFIEQDYTIKDVLEVKAGSGIKLEITQGSTESLKLKASAKLVKYVHVDLTNNTLRLSVDREFSDVSSWFSQGQVIFTLVVKDLQLLDLSGGVEANLGNFELAKLTVKNSGGTETKFSRLNVKELNIEASGGSDVSLRNLKSESARLKVSGGSEFDLEESGTTNTLAIDASGGSDCNAKNLASVSAEVEAGGGSDVDVRASTTLKVSAGGASDVNYYGKPQVTSTIGGASDLTAHN
ncbi:MAG: DUF2807 domain-containing protein [Cellvibrio sp.]